ncbi:unnamed protein product [Penicillium olsonii]|uniref:DUF1308 domain-containing protein n=1 Tax=Penicillium olsonii TaxID=99116 RepID=A0A9W4HYZ1_PENOL|nr:unnamed protein product [Penicillium olsonii]CAG8171099.1 unnamed protein product [Penicillium olsonii]
MMATTSGPHRDIDDSQTDNTSTGTARPAAEADEPTTRTSITLSRQLNQECDDLLSEIDAYSALVASTLRNPQLVEVRQFRTNVNAESKILQRMGKQIQAAVETGPCSADPDTEMRLVHALRSSNLPFYQAVWRITKGSCTGLVALGRRFYWEGESKATVREKMKKVGSQPEKPPNKDKRKSAFVDIVADDGQEWVKVSTVSENRLLFEMAEKGWECDTDSEEEWSEDGKGRTVLQHSDDDEDDDQMELIKLARDLRRAANSTRVRYGHPRLRIVIPKIEEGSVPAIDSILTQMRSFGVKVECQQSLPEPTGTGLVHLLPQPFKNFTSTLNVDCTILLALVSDLSHIKDIVPAFQLHPAILRQIEVEKEKPLLPSELWPAMSARELVATSEAATRFREIVETIGTDTEKTRTRLLLGEQPYENLGHDGVLQKFQELSDYPVPAEWKLPIRVVDAQPVITAAKERGDLPAVIHEVTKTLSDINNSVFLYGWITGLTTISSNRTIDKQIEATVESNRQDDDDLKGPDVWICDTARSLVGKDRDRKT